MASLKRVAQGCCSLAEDVCPEGIQQDQDAVLTYVLASMPACVQAHVVGTCAWAGEEQGTGRCWLYFQQCLVCAVS